MDWNIPRISDNPLQLSLNDGEQLFIVGANGSGKSALIQHIVSSNKDQNVRRISAHRQTWFQSESIDLTPRSRRQVGEQITRQEVQDQARWRDEYAEQRQSAVLFDLVAKQNARANLITRHVEENNVAEAVKLAAAQAAPFHQINELLALGTLQVQLELFNDEEIRTRHNNAGNPYSIAQMSDGERNSAIIAATVLTVEPGTILLIDEPERHLHRSIIEPFLSALFQQRRDCTFVVSTHEISLPISLPEAHVLLARSC